MIQMSSTYETMNAMLLSGISQQQASYVPTHWHKYTEELTMVHLIWHKF